MAMNKLLPPLVDVIIPSYNYADKVTRAIKSVKLQTLNNLHCYIVDDGSTDNTKQAVEEAIKDDPRFTYVYQDNAGVANARNKGVFMGEGRYVCCLDADDAIDPRFLEICVAALESSPAIAIAYTGLYYIKPDGEEGLSPWPDKFNYDKQLTGGNQIPTCCVSRRDMWERLGGQRQRYAPAGAGEEDAEFWLRAGAYGFNAMKVTDAGLFIYSWMSGRVSGNKQHHITDWRSKHPWVKDEMHPFASMAKPKRASHPVRQYDQPVVSVIIPVGPGHGSAVIDALDSLESQTFRKWEAILVMDNETVGFPWTSKDKPEAFDEFRKAYPYVRYYRSSGSTHKHGAGGARNFGVEVARAPLILFLDADDWLYPETLSTMMAYWDSEQSIVYSDYVGKATITPELAEEYRRGSRLLQYNDKTGTAYVTWQTPDFDCDLAQSQPKAGANGLPYLWCLISSLVPKSWHNEIGGFDESMGSWEDWDYWIRMAKSGKCFVRVPQQLAVYRFSTGNRRETGLQEHKSLLQYLIRKYEGVNTMPCSGCPKGQVTRPMSNSAPPAMTNVVQTAQSLKSTQGDGEFVMCQYVHPNRGEHRVVGGSLFAQQVPGVNMVRREQGFSIDYGYRSGGSRFLVHINDIQAQPFYFTPVRAADPSYATVSPAAPPPPPPPAIDEDQPPNLSPKEEGAFDFDVEKAFDMQTLPGVTPLIAQQLAEMGIVAPEGIIKLGQEGLKELKGVGPSRAALILAGAEKAVG